MLEEVEQFISCDGELVFTLTSNGYKYMTMNLVRHLQAARVPWKLCIVCADMTSYRYFTEEGVPAIHLPDNQHAPDYGSKIARFGTPSFKVLTKKKLDVLAALSGHKDVKLGVYLDGDIAVYRDFLPDLRERLGSAGAPDLLIQCDESNKQCANVAACPYMCTGFLAWRKAAAAAPTHIQSLFQVTADLNDTWASTDNDQSFFNTRATQLGEGIQIRTLPRDLYPNGVFSAQGTLAEKPLLLHYNYMVGDEKSNKMRENGDWLMR
jgi:hypothetical protein